MYDVIVVGARCAGAPTAMLLARKGYRVLLVDRATFPSDTLSSHAQHPTATALLKRWGLLDRVAASNCPRVDTFQLDFGPFTLSGTPLPIDGVDYTYAPRRALLDALLIEAAVEAGVEFRQAFSVDEILVDGDRVTGIRGRSRQGTSGMEKARLVVGADGRHSLVARAVQAPEYATKPPLTCAYYAYWSGVPVEGAQGYSRPGRIIFTFPTNDGLTVTYLAWPRDMFQAVRTNLEQSVQQTFDLIPHLAERLRNGRRESRFLGTADLPNFFRKPYGPGWALVGDAGYHKDPYLAQGISDAFRDADLLARSIDSGLAEDRPLDAALADYECQRNQAALPEYELTTQFATLQPPPAGMQQLLAALAGNQEETNRFWSALLGTLPVPEFFAPTNVQRIIARANADARSSESEWRASDCNRRLDHAGARALW